MTSAPSAPSEASRPASWKRPLASPGTWKRLLALAGRFLAALPLSLLILEGALRLLGSQAPDEVPGFFAPDPELVFNLAPNVDVTWRNPEFEYRLVTNSLGMREDRELWPKRPGEFRVLAVGDSTVYGHGVDAKDAWPRQLEKLLNGRAKPPGVERYTVWNAGAMGFRMDQSAANLVRLLDVAEPDLAIIGASAAFSFQQAAERPRGVKVEGGKVVPDGEGAFEEPLLQRAEIWLRRHSRLWSRLRMGLEPRLAALGLGGSDARAFLEPPISSMRPVYESARAAAMEAWSRGVPTVLLFVPDVAQASQKRFEAISGGRLDRWLKRRQPDRFHMLRLLGVWAAMDGLPLIDPTGEIMADKNGDESFFPADRHMNERGSRAAARGVLKGLLQRRLLVPKRQPAPEAAAIPRQR